jgi:hypothetical protein
MDWQTLFFEGSVEFAKWLFSWGGLAFVLMMICYYFFIREIKKPDSKEKVNVATWAAWGLLDLLLLFAMLQTGVMPWTVPAYVVGVSWVIYTAYQRGAVFQPLKMDYFCAALVVIAIGSWFFLADLQALTGLYLFADGAQAAIVLAAVGCSVATIPLVVHVWNEPRSNSLTAWIFGLAGCASAVIGVEKWSLVWADIVTHSLIQVSFFGLAIVVTAVLLRRFLPEHRVVPAT